MTCHLSLLGQDKRGYKPWEVMPEEMGPETTAEDGQRRCWRHLRKIFNASVSTLTRDTDSNSVCRSDRLFVAFRYSMETA